jgi:transcriptional antiterminator RfaH
MGKMKANWYVLHSKPNKEDLLWGQLLAQKIETFYPRVRVQVVNPRARKVRPYFPGYLFVHVDLEQIGKSTLRWIPGAHDLVTCDGQPASVPEHLIQAIRSRVDEINAAGGELFDGLKPGERVLIQDGPFAGYEALFDARLPDGQRVRVLLELLQKSQVPLELPAGHIQCIRRSKT